MKIPHHPFLENVKKSAVLVREGNILELVGDGKEDTTPNKGEILDYNGHIFRLKDKHQSLEELDKQYYADINLDNLVAEGLAEKEKGLISEIEEKISALNQHTTLTFIERHVFKYLRGETEDTSSQPYEEQDPVPDKIRARKIKNGFFILSDFFSKGSFLFLGKDVEKLEDGEYRPFHTLETLEKFFEEKVLMQIDMAIRRRDYQIQELEKRRNNLKKIKQKRYEEKDFGFRKENGDYYVFIKSDPHAFLKNGKYYCFESTEVGIQIPIADNNIDEVSIYNSQPVVFDDEYDHPCLSREKYGSRFRKICYKGQESIVANKEIELKLKNKENEAKKRKKNSLDIKAIKLIYLLSVAGSYSITLGYEKGTMKPYRNIQDSQLTTKEDSPKITPKTEAEYLNWNKEKIRRRRLEKFTEGEFKVIPISRNAFDKMYNYSLLLRQITKKDLECGGYLTSPKNVRGGIAYDASYMFDQDVTPGRGWGSIESLERALKEAEEEECTILGFWHSHGAFQVIPSQIDKEMANFVITQESKTLEYDAGAQSFELIERGDKTGIIVPSAANPYESLTINISKAGISKEDIDVRLKKIDRIKYWYTIIINNNENRPFYGDIHFKVWNPTEKTYEKIEKREKIKLEFLDVEKSKKDLSSLLDEVYQNTKFNQKKLSEYEEYRERYDSLKNMISQAKVINLQRVIPTEELKAEYKKQEKSDGIQELLEEKSEDTPPKEKIVFNAGPPQDVEEKSDLSKEYNELETLIAEVDQIDIISLSKKETQLIKKARHAIGYYNSKNHLEDDGVKSKTKDLGLLIRKRVFSIEHQIESDQEFFKGCLDKLNSYSRKQETGFIETAWKKTKNLIAPRIELKGKDFVDFINKDYNHAKELISKYAIYREICDVVEVVPLLNQVMMQTKSEITEEKTKIMTYVSSENCSYGILGNILTGNQKQKQPLAEAADYLEALDLKICAKTFRRKWGLE